MLTMFSPTADVNYLIDIVCLHVQALATAWHFHQI